jgi:putative ATP-dependent endonuclease of OLD family
MIEAATGKVPLGIADEKKYKSHAQTWFKQEKGGRELAAKVFSLSLWVTLRAELLPFCNAARTAIGLADVADLPP